MSEKNANQRIMLTKRLLKEALLKMLQTQNINKIAIRELCQIAGINRTTFYNHYGSQYEVLNDIAKDFIDGTSYRVLNDLEKGMDFKACLVDVLDYIKEHMEFAKLLLNQNNYDLAEHIKVSLPQFDSMVIRNIQGDADTDKKKAIASFVQYGTLRLLWEWIQTDCQRASQDEAELILYVAGKTISG